MPVVECWLGQVLLHDVVVLRSFDLASSYLVSLSVGHHLPVLLHGLDALLDLQVLVHVLLLLFLLVVQLLAKVLYFLCDEDASALRARFWLTNENHRRQCLCLRFRHLAFLKS